MADFLRSFVAIMISTLQIAWFIFLFVAVLFAGASFVTFIALKFGWLLGVIAAYFTLCFAFAVLDNRLHP